MGSHAGTANQEKRGTHSHKFGVTRINFKVNVDEVSTLAVLYQLTSYTVNDLV